MTSITKCFCRPDDHIFNIVDILAVRKCGFGLKKVVFAAFFVKCCCSQDGDECICVLFVFMVEENNVREEK